MSSDALATRIARTISTDEIALVATMRSLTARTSAALSASRRKSFTSADESA